ncbi:A1S_1983 family putative colistin resistance protein [Acinetobacter guerrae]|uniref:A1S_1983 family putative colistin resistance protein n=1 Tax=Acinetobacter guerrae TaxID=1843371 RepID=UPI00128BB3DD|nr:hypothetical protein [Acinetobacter guerrae]MPW44780.1 hypothetical protein [Acinetobacter guerrae]
MTFRTDRFPLKNVFCALTISFCFSSAYATDSFDCSKNRASFASKKICSKNFMEARHELNNKFLVAYLISDAPIKLLYDTHSIWLNRLQQCKAQSCISQQFELREDDLNFYTSLNQSLTQHFLKFEHGKIAKQPIHLQVHQLTKDKVKIEGIAYRNPNNRNDSQTVPLLAYTAPDKKEQIFDNEHDCKYNFNFQKSILVVKTEQKGCERFSGIYRLYD